MTDSLLAIDPEPGLARELGAALGASNAARLVRAATAYEAIEILDRGWTDVVVFGPDCPGIDGYDLVPQLRRRSARATLVLADSDSLADLARIAAARGVREVLQRPIEPETLALVLQRARESQQRARSHGLLLRELRRALGEHPLVAASASMIRVLELVERIAAASHDVLIEGEPGTGKESIARAIHGLSSRRDAPFVALACEGVTAAHLESELFGRARLGETDSAPARRGLLAEAQGGTLFLDEIAALPSELQARLASALEAGKVASDAGEGASPIDVRVIASTHRDLERESKSGAFDASLLAKFERARVVVPPLRERREDIPLLTDHILGRVAIRHGRAIREIGEGVLERLARHAWPGNVRELENTLERAILVAAGARIELGDLPEAIQRADNQEQDVWTLRSARRAAETAAIRRALRATGGNRTHAARRLRISQRALLYKLKEYGIRD